MKGLLLKDIYAQKSNWKVMLPLLLVVGSFIAISSSEGGAMSVVGAIVVMLAITTSIQSFSFDEKVQWNTLAAGMPLSRRTMVLEKYLFGLLIIGIANLLIAFPFLAYQMGINKMSMGITGLYIFFPAMFLLAIIPLKIIFGEEKSRYFILLIGFLPVMVLGLLSKLGLKIGEKINALGQIPPANLVIYGLIILVISSVISIALSVKFFEKKDL